jgi:hypothetical protein
MPSVKMAAFWNVAPFTDVSDVLAASVNSVMSSKPYESIVLKSMNQADKVESVEVNGGGADNNLPRMGKFLACGLLLPSCWRP